MRFVGWMAVATSACSFTPGVQPPDARSIDAVDPGIGWSPPVELTTISAAPATDDPSLTNDLLQIYFGSSRLGSMGAEDIWMAKRASKDVPFGTPVNVAELNSASAETTMKITGLGTAIFFASDRDGDMDIYYSTRPNVDATWNPPQRVPELSKVNVGDWAPFAQPDQLRLVLCSGASEASEALYVSTRASTAEVWGAPQKIAELDDPAHSECDPNEPGPNVLYYSSDYLTPGKPHIYRASRTSSGAPYGNRTGVDVNLQGFTDRDPWVSPEETTLVFASDRNGMTMQLFISTR